MFELPQSFMKQFEIRVCPDCGLEHAPVRTCEEAAAFHEAVNASKEKQ